MPSKLETFVFKLTTGICALSLVSGCTYLSNVSKQAEYQRIQKEAPTQRNLKFLLNNQTHFVYGRILDEDNKHSGKTIAIAAFSNKFEQNELVDKTFSTHVSTHYGLNLPDGDFDIFAFADSDQNGKMDQTEIIGRLNLTVSPDQQTDNVFGDADIILSGAHSANWDISIDVPTTSDIDGSLFFPKGTIRSLDDPLFDRSNAILGMYEPGALLETSPTMFHALEEESYKIPVIFVHGIGGSPREFATIVDQLDRDTYKPWFFYYPSGADLDQLSKLFYDIFLSGKTINSNMRPTIIVAHSMGGLVSRAALNRIKGREKENTVDLFITISSPLGGHPAAAKGEKHGLITLPSWKDLNPDSRFIKKLHAQPLPEGVDYNLIYTYKNEQSLESGKGGDGTVPLANQLEQRAIAQADVQLGINNTHTGVLQDPAAIKHIIEAINNVKGDLPEEHWKILKMEGFDVDDEHNYTPLERFSLRVYGPYMNALANGDIHHLDIPILKQFVDVVHGKKEAKTPTETAWLKYIASNKN